MADVARTLVVQRVEPGISDPARVHAVLAVSDTAGVYGALHLFTSDPALAACLVPGATLELRDELPAAATLAGSAPMTNEAQGRCASCRWLSEVAAFRPDDGSRECLNPELRAEPMAEPGARFGGIAVEPTFGCIQWEAKPPRD